MHYDNINIFNLKFQFKIYGLKMVTWNLVQKILVWRLIAGYIPITRE